MINKETFITCMNSFDSVFSGIINALQNIDSYFDEMTNSNNWQSPTCEYIKEQKEINNKCLEEIRDFKKNMLEFLNLTLYTKIDNYINPIASQRQGLLNGKNNLNETGCFECPIKKELLNNLDLILGPANNTNSNFDKLLVKLNTLKRLVDDFSEYDGRNRISDRYDIAGFKQEQLNNIASKIRNDISSYYKNVSKHMWNF